MPAPAPPDPPPFPRGSSADERIHYLLEWLRTGNRLTTALAARALDVSRRTISRDLAYMRSTLSLDVAFDPVQGSYVLSTEHTALPFLAFPGLAPILLNGATEPAAEQVADSEIWVRYSARSIDSYRSRGGALPADVLSADGTVDAYFPLKNPDEFMSYALSRGSDIEILAPSAFRDRVHMEIRRMLSIYEAEDPGSP